MRIIEGTPEECRAYAERMRSTQPTGWDRKEMYPEEYRQEATRSPRIEAEPDQDKYYPFGRSVRQRSHIKTCAHCGGPCDKPLQTYQKDGNLFCCKEHADSHIDKTFLASILGDYLGPEEVAEVMERMV